MRFSRITFALPAVALVACNSDAVTAPTVVFTENPCSVTGTLTLAVAQTARVDCGNGGTTLTLAGNGANYMIVAQLPVDNVQNGFLQYHLAASASADAAVDRMSALNKPSLDALASAAARAGIRQFQPRARQLALERVLSARAASALRSGMWRPSRMLSRAAPSGALKAAAPAVGDLRSFQVLANVNGTSFKAVGARLTYAGSGVLVYVDTLAPANGFSASQLQAFGQLFDQTLYPIDTAAFGPPTDVDQNGRVIMLMSPAVNALTPTSVCQSEGYTAGFFNPEDLGGGASDPNSNQGEIFYSIVPDPAGTASCAHSVSDVGTSVPPTFVHELQHLISYSQHVVVHGGQAEAGWLDEGMSIVAEELASRYYEKKCPPPACRTDPSQMFPDSSQGFIANFFFDSYQYALLPDTVSVTLHDDSEDGFSWRGGDWLLMRWLGDQQGEALFRKMDQNTVTGVANIESATAQSFPALFSDFGIALYADSLPGLPRATAPAVDRFVTRNVSQLWARLFATSASANVPLPDPLSLFPITNDTTSTLMEPGANAYWRLDTPATAATVTIEFAGPGAKALPAILKPQLAIFRLPSGQ